MPYIGNNHIAGDHTNNFKVLDDISSFTATFDGSATSVVDTTNNTIRVVEHRFIQGQRVTYTNGSGGNIGGLTTGTAYFVIFDSASTIKLATSASNAANSTAINLSAVGSGSSHTLNVAFDGVNRKFKLTHGSGTGARLNNATQINVAINNVVQRPNLDPNNFTDGFALEDNHKIVFQTAPTSEDIFWGSIIANTLTTFDISDHKIDTFTGDGSTTEFTLSHTPANNESLMVSINGVLQHPSNASTVRAYTLIASIIQFTAAPAVGDEIQVRHLGFAGATTADVSGFYGRTGNVVLTANDHITTGDITARNINASGILTASSASFGGNVSIGGTLTYEDVSNIDSVGIITARDGIHVGAGVSVVGVGTFGALKVGSGVTIESSGQLTSNNNIRLSANSNNHSATARLQLGSDQNFEIYHNASRDNIIDVDRGNLVIKNSGSDLPHGSAIINRTDGQFLVANQAQNKYRIKAYDGGAVELYHNDDKKFSTQSGGVALYGVTDLYGMTGNASLNLRSGGTAVYQTITFKNTAGAYVSAITSWSGGTLFFDSNSLLVFNSGGTEIAEIASTGFNPRTDSARDLGTNTKRWRNLYADTLYGDGSNLTGIDADKIQEGNSFAEVLDTGTNGIFRFVSEGNERLRITHDAKVGINTNNPSAPLEIQGNNGINDAALYFTRHGSPANNSVIGQLLFRKGTDSVAIIEALRESANDDAYIRMLTQPTGGNVSERVRITSTGMVNIGTNNQASGHAASSKLRVGTASGSDVGVVVFGNNDTTTPALIITNWDGAQTQNKSIIHFDNSGWGSFQIGCVGGADAFGIFDDSVERVRITSSGRFGVGTSSPDHIFEVEDNNSSIAVSRSGANAQLLFKSNSVGQAGQIQVSESSGGGVMLFSTKTTGGTITERFRIDTSGKLLVGKTSGSSKVDIDASNSTLRLTKANASDYVGFQLDRDTGTPGGYLGLSGASGHYAATSAQHDLVLRSQSNLLFATNGNQERLRITSDGNITFGVTGGDTPITSSPIRYVSGGRDYWNSTKGDYRALRYIAYNGGNSDNMYGIGISASELEIQSQSAIGVYAGSDGGGTGRRRKRITINNAGSVAINNTDANAVHSMSNYDHGNLSYNHRNGRVLTSNGLGWDGNESSDGADPILVLGVTDRAGNSDIGDAYGLCLHSDSQDNNDYGPLIGWSNRSNSGSYNTTYAAIVGQKIGQATDANWSSGALHFHTGKPAGFNSGYMNSTADMTIDAYGHVLTPRNSRFYAISNTGSTDTGDGATGKISNQLEALYLDDNDDYNSSLGRFTAPVDGAYEFHFAALHRTLNSGGGSAELTFYKNGANLSQRSFGYSHIGSGGSSGDHQHHHIHGIFNLTAGDYIEVYIYQMSSGQDYYVAQGLSYFSGKLLG